MDKIVTDEDIMYGVLTGKFPHGFAEQVGSIDILVNAGFMRYLGNEGHRSRFLTLKEFQLGDNLIEEDVILHEDTENYDE